MNNLDGVELKRVKGKVAVIMYDRVYYAEGESRYGTYLSDYDENSKYHSDNMIAVIEVEYEIPTNDHCYDLITIEKLKKQKEAIIAESRAKQTEIEGKIQKLIALEHLG